MNQQSIESLLESTKVREEELRKDREALERVRALLKREAGIESPSSAKGFNSENGNGSISLSAAIREAVQHAGHTFTSSDLRKYIDEKHPGLQVATRLGTLSSVLSRLAETGKIKTTGDVQPGKAKTYLKLTESLV